MPGMLRPLLTAVSLAVATAVTPGLAAEPIGTPPAYAGEHVVPALPNAGAFEIAAWVPDLDQGDVPQGLTVLGDHVLVAAYREREGNQDCRIHRFVAETGAHAGTVDLPAPCSHAGGLAVAGGRLFLTDTWKLIELDAAALFDPARHAESVIRTLSLRFPLRGSFAAGTGTGLWIGEYNRAEGGSLRHVTLAAVDAADAGGDLGPDAVERTIPAPARSQGATVDRRGDLWVSASSSQFGRLYRLDPADGRVLAQFEMPAGTEDLGFDQRDRLWTVSEAGAQKYRNWPAFHPFVMRLRPERLR